MHLYRYVLGRDRGRRWLPVSRALKAHLARPFSGRARRRVMVYYHPQPVSWPMVYPLLYYRRALAARYGAEIRAEALDPAAPPRWRDADVTIFQCWFTLDGGSLETLAAAARAATPSGTVVFLDPAASNDLRLARYVAPHVDLFARKALFRDPAEWVKPRRGDSWISAYYNALYGLDHPVVDWQVPEAILPKLRVWPGGFMTDPDMIDALGGALGTGPRPIDVHARFVAKGEGWYHRQRDAAEAVLAGLSDREIRRGAGVSRSVFLAELKTSKICLSPFGFGEQAWRDIEAIAYGAALVKQSMDHLETRPDLWQPGLYAPCRWDFTDLAAVLAGLLDDAAARDAMAARALENIARWLDARAFVDDPLIAEMLGGAADRATG